MDKGTILILPRYKNLEGAFCHLIPSTVSSNQVASSQLFVYNVLCLSEFNSSVCIPL